MHRTSHQEVIIVKLTIIFTYALKFSTHAQNIDIQIRNYFFFEYDFLTLIQL